MDEEQRKALQNSLKTADQEDTDTEEQASPSAAVIPPEDPRVQEQYDEDMDKAIRLFFDNKFQEAETIFKSKGEQDPLYSMGMGAILVMRAMMTFKEEDILSATTQLERAERLANAQLANYTEPMTIMGAAKTMVSLPFMAAGSILRFSGITAKREEETVVLSNGELRATMIKAECNLIIAMMNFLQERIIGFVKAGFKLRRAYSEYAKAWSEYSKLPIETMEERYDRHTVGAIRFGIGTMNVALSFLPAKIVSLIAILGIKGDSGLGFRLLQQGFDTDNIRSPMSSLMLLLIYQMTISFAPHFYWDEVFQKADSLIPEIMKRYPNSAIHLFMAARLERGRRNISQSNIYFQTCFDAQTDWKEFRNLCSYEMGMNAVFNLDWNKAKDYMDELYEASYWSRAFYAYFYAACLDMLSFNASDLDERKKWKEMAIKLYEKVPGLVTRKFGGRTIGVEQYVVRKVKIFQKDEYQRTMLPIFELIGIWNGFKFMSIENLRKVKEIVNKQIREADAYEGWSAAEVSERTSTLHMTLGSVCRELGEYEEAESEYQWIFTREEDFKEEKLVAPFTYFEQGILNYLKGDLEGTRTSFKNARKYTDFNFEFRLDFRIHLSLLELESRGV